jgi:cell division protein FtsB
MRYSRLSPLATPAATVRATNAAQDLRTTLARLDQLEAENAALKAECSLLNTAVERLRRRYQSAAKRARV